MINATGFDPDNAVESLDSMFSDESPERTSELGKFVDWVDSKLPEKEDNPILYWLSFLVLGPIMLPICIIGGLAEAFDEGFSGPKKKQRYCWDEDANEWIPVVIDEVTGEVTPGIGLS